MDGGWWKCFDIHMAPSVSAWSWSKLKKLQAWTIYIYIYKINVIKFNQEFFAQISFCSNDSFRHYAYFKCNVIFKSLHSNVANVAQCTAVKCPAFTSCLGMGALIYCLVLTASQDRWHKWSILIKNCWDTVIQREERMPAFKGFPTQMYHSSEENR